MEKICCLLFECAGVVFTLLGMHLEYLNHWVYYQDTGLPKEKMEYMTTVNTNYAGLSVVGRQLYSEDLLGVFILSLLACVFLAPPPGLS